MQQYYCGSIKVGRKEEVVFEASMEKPTHYEVKIDLSEMKDGDKFMVKVFTATKYTDYKYEWSAIETFKDKQDEPILVIKSTLPLQQGEKIKIVMKKIKGEDRKFNYYVTLTPLNSW